MSREEDRNRERKKRRQKERQEILSLEKGTEYRFPLEEPADREKIDALNDALSHVGVTFRCEDRVLVICVRELNLKARSTRSAGRKKKTISILPDSKNPLESLPESLCGTATVNKVEALIDAVGCEAAARALHMSKTGMYKRLRNAKAKAKPASPEDGPIGLHDLRF